jgi:(1->4)-alpha-D-glucan 1-alpha-D-glucosylmutase
MLSLFPGDWKDLVEQWRRMNKIHVTVINDQPAPSLNDEYFIYQSLVAGFPADGKVTDEYRERLVQYIVKAFREAKIHTSWREPNADYENACTKFIHQLLSPGQSFLASFQPFITRIDRYLYIYSLTQTLLKITAPGIPDIYQGCELWDLSYVDPDNRRLVNYDVRQKYLHQLIQKEQEGIDALLAFVQKEQATGMGKLWVTRKALHCRREKAALFLEGDYLPVYTNRPAPVVAYLRRYENEWALIAAPTLHPTITMADHSLWDDVCLQLPEGIPGQGLGLHWITGERYTVTTELPLASLFGRFQVALLTSL